MIIASGSKSNSTADKLDQFLQQNGIDKKHFEDFIYKTIILSLTDQILTKLKSRSQKTALREKIRKLPIGNEDPFIERLIREHLELKLNKNDLSIIKKYLDFFLRSGSFRTCKPSLVEINKRLAEQNKKCAFCGVEIGNGNYHIDHILPHSFFGDELISDFQLLCPSCNKRKSSKVLTTLNLVFVPDCPEGQL